MNSMFKIISTTNTTDLKCQTNEAKVKTLIRKNKTKLESDFLKKNNNKVMDIFVYTSNV